MQISVKRFVTGNIENNTYLVSDGTGHCLMIDPGESCRIVLDTLSANEMELQGVLLTHGHCDHIFGLEEVTKQFPEVAIYLHPADHNMLQDSSLNGSSRFAHPFIFSGPVNHLIDGPTKIGAFEFEVLHTPGHSPGSCCLRFGLVCFTGDTLFAGSIGRYDLPGGDANQLLKSIHDKLLDLEDSTQLHPGHGPDSTIAYEKSHNPIIRWA